MSDRERVAIVTGGYAGVGLETTRVLAAAGAKAKSRGETFRTIAAQLPIE